jgi:hypothetical protein
LFYFIFFYFYIAFCCCFIFLFDFWFRLTEREREKVNAPAVLKSNQITSIDIKLNRYYFFVWRIFIFRIAYKKLIVAITFYLFISIVIINYSFIKIKKKINKSTKSIRNNHYQCWSANFHCLIIVRFRYTKRRKKIKAKIFSIKSKKFLLV